MFEAGASRERQGQAGSGRDKQGVGKQGGSKRGGDKQGAAGAIRAGASEGAHRGRWRSNNNVIQVTATSCFRKLSHTHRRNKQTAHGCRHTQKHTVCMAALVH